MVINWRNKLDTEAKKNKNTQYNRDLRSFEIRFDLNRPSDSIRFEGDWPVRKFFNRIGRACSFARRKLSQTTQIINGTALSGTVNRLANSVSDHTPVV